MRVLRFQAPCIFVMLCDLGGSTCPLWASGGLSISRFSHSWPWPGVRGSPSELPLSLEAEVALGWYLE